MIIPNHKTKIIATLGPASNDKETIKGLIIAGVDVFRLNFSHGDHHTHHAEIKAICAANDELGTNVGILADLQGPKIRLGDIADPGVKVRKDDIVWFTNNEEDLGPEKFFVSYNDLAKDANPGDRILINDGAIALTAIAQEGSMLKAKVLNDGLLESHKGVNLPDTAVTIPSLPDKDLNDLKFILSLEEKVNWIALSFVRKPTDLERLRGIISLYNHPARIIAKIEKPEAITNIDEIIAASDAIMIARGDLGVELPLERVPVIQKEIVTKCRIAAKPVIIATQMMESMIHNHTPTRAEVTDVANAIYDGADAVMLSGETARGDHPIKVIETFTSILDYVETQEQIYFRYYPTSKDSSHFISDALCYNAVMLARDTNAKAILGSTMSGYTAYKISSYRPNCRIFIFTENENLLNSLSLVWGVRTIFYDQRKSTNQAYQENKEFLTKLGLLHTGDVIIHTSSMPIMDMGKTNALKIGVV